MLELAVCFHARALAACFPRQDHVWITTDQLVRFQKNEIDEMPASCKLDSAKIRVGARNNQPYPMKQERMRCDFGQR